MVELPYSSSKAGAGREKEIRDTLRGIGATAVGFMVDDDADCVLTQFRIAGREITIPVSIGAYEKAWLRANPCGPRTEATVHRQRARAQAEIAVWGVLADWVKAQATMILCGMMDVETVFLSHIHTPSGKRVIQAVRTENLLPPPQEKGTNQ